MYKAYLHEILKMKSTSLSSQLLLKQTFHIIRSFNVHTPPVSIILWDVHSFWLANKICCCCQVAALYKLKQTHKVLKKTAVTSYTFFEKVHIESYPAFPFCSGAVVRTGELHFCIFCSPTFVDIQSAESQIKGRSSRKVRTTCKTVFNAE